MELLAFPQQLKNLKLELLKADQKVRSAQESVDLIEGDIQSIVLSENLKNEDMRKQRRVQLQRESQTWQKANKSLHSVLDKRQVLKIELEFLVDSFTVQKLIERDRTIRAETLIRGI